MAFAHIPLGNYMRPTVRIRTRNLPNGPGVIEQMWINDEMTLWEWRRVPLVPEDAPIKGEGPPPPFGDQQQEPSS